MIEMKRTLYLECYSGISGDMTVAALLDAGADKETLTRAIESIKPLTDGFETKISRVLKSGIDACDFNVILDKEHENHDHDMEYLHGEHSHEHGYNHGHHHEHGEHSHEHGGHHEHSHEHAHHHTGMHEISHILNAADITDKARTLAFKIFDILAQAEAKAHNKPVGEVHFHEVGAVDSIVDIMSAAVCIDSVCEKYNISDIAVSQLYEGHGSVRCQHGILPIPVPAVANIVQSCALSLHFMDVQGEFVTPTGAAIAAAVKTTEKCPDSFKVIATGIGAGKRNYEKASILRAMILEEVMARNAATNNVTTEKDTIYKLESNIDDCSAEALGYVMDRLLEAGARDVHYTPVYMKKNRPAYQLNVICTKSDMQKLEEIIFRETTTIGIRRVEMERTVLKRSQMTAITSLGEVEIKRCGARCYPEYESLVRLCKEKQIPYLEAYNKVFTEINTETEK